VCAACQSVYATAELLYRRLVAREMARLERRAPGIGCAALAALHQRLASLDSPAASQNTRCSSAELDWMPEEWELNRLDAFLTELRAGATTRGARA